LKSMAMFPILRNDSQTSQEVKTFHVSTATLEQPTNTTTKTVKDLD